MPSTENHQGTSGTTSTAEAEQQSDETRSSNSNDSIDVPAINFKKDKGKQGMDFGSDWSTRGINNFDGLKTNSHQNNQRGQAAKNPGMSKKADSNPDTRSKEVVQKNCQQMLG